MSHFKVNDKPLNQMTIPLVSASSEVMRDGADADVSAREVHRRGDQRSQFDDKNHNTADYFYSGSSGNSYLPNSNNNSNNSDNGSNYNISSSSKNNNSSSSKNNNNSSSTGNIWYKHSRSTNSTTSQVLPLPLESFIPHSSSNGEPLSPVHPL